MDIEQVIQTMDEEANASQKENNSKELFTKEEVISLIQKEISKLKKQEKKEVVNRPSLDDVVYHNNNAIVEGALDSFIQSMKDEINRGEYVPYLYSSQDAAYFGRKYEVIISGFVLEFVEGKTTKIPNSLINEVLAKFTSSRVSSHTGFTNTSSVDKSSQLEAWMNEYVQRKTFKSA